MSNELKSKWTVISGLPDPRASIDSLESIIKQQRPDLLPRLNEISGMYKAYELSNDRAILEMIIAELSKLLQEVLMSAGRIQAPKRGFPNDFKGVVTEFVEFMEKDKGLSQSSIRIYRAAVKKAFGFKETDRVGLDLLFQKTEGCLREYSDNDDKDFRWQNRNNISAVRVFWDFLCEIQSNR